MEIERPCVGTVHLNGCDLKNSRTLRSTNGVFNYVIVHLLVIVIQLHIYTGQGEKRSITFIMMLGLKGLV